jgi:1-deoxyxylulose-5-phosphate synthase
LHFPGTLFAADETRRWHATNQFPLLAWSSVRQGGAGRRFRPDDESVDDITRGYFSDDNFERMRRAEELGEGKNASALQVALAFVLRQDFPVVALVGPSSIDNLKSALGALEVELTSDELRYLDLSH